MILLNCKDIQSVFTMRDAIEADKKAFSMSAKNEIDTPLRTAISGKYDGTFLFMPAYAPGEDTAVLKTINIFPQNINRNLMTSPSQILLIDGENGYVQALLDGTTVTQMRTGASTGAAFDILAKKTCRKGALIGTGGQAQAQMMAMIEARNLEEVAVFSPNEKRCREFCDRMQKKYKDVKIICAPDSEQCVEDADLVITVTTSSYPVFDAKNIKNGATVSCVGTYEPHKRELDSALLPRASKIICDDKKAALSETGDLLLPISEGIICESDIQGSLGDVINETIVGRENDDEIIVYETVGFAAMDLITAKEIYEKALEKGAGIIWE